MTKEEAIAILDGFKHNPLFNEQHFEALDMAISALSENKGDLISRQAVLDELEKWDWQDLYLPIHFKQILDDVPSVENKGEPKIGRWILTSDDECEYCTCSECGYQNGENWMIGSHIKFCQECGANMRGE